MTTTPETPDRAASARAARTRTKHERWADEMRQAGWTILKPGGLSVIVDADGARWERGEDGFYRLDGDSRHRPRTLDYIRETYGLLGQVSA